MAGWSELKELWEEKYSIKEDAQDEQITKEGMARLIDEYCRQYLKNAESTFVFEVNEAQVKYMPAVLQNPTLTNMYRIRQISATLYEARLATYNF